MKLFTVPPARCTTLARSLVTVRQYVHCLGVFLVRIALGNGEPVVRLIALETFRPGHLVCPMLFAVTLSPDNPKREILPERVPFIH